MRKAVFVAFLLVLGSVLLGATVLREPIAWAASPFQQVIVANDASAPVPTKVTISLTRQPNGTLVYRADDLKPIILYACKAS